MLCELQSYNQVNDNYGDPLRGKITNKIMIIKRTNKVPNLKQFLVKEKEMNKDSKDYCRKCDVVHNCEYADKDCDGIDCPDDPEEQKGEKQIINGYEILKPITIDALYVDRVCTEAKKMLSNVAKFELFEDITKHKEIQTLINIMNDYHPEFLDWLEERGYIKKVKVEEKTYKIGDMFRISRNDTKCKLLKVYSDGEAHAQFFTIGGNESWSDIVRIDHSLKITKEELDKMTSHGWKHIEN